MKIVIIGANGQLGSDIGKVAHTEDCIGLTMDDLDIRNKDQVQKSIYALQPDVVINTAAYNNVDTAEDHITEVCDVNIAGVQHLVDACTASNCTLVHISTDYVFGEDRNRTEPYTETDREGPVNMYGITKLAGEYYIRSHMENYIIARTAGLFGIVGALGKGGNFVETILKLGKERKQVTVVDDQVLSPTYTVDCAQQLLKIIQEKQRGIFNVVSEGSCSWYEFTKHIYTLCSLQTRLSPCTSDEYKRRALRPSYSALDNARLNKLGINIMHNWKDSIQNYLIEKGHIAE